MHGILYTLRNVECSYDKITPVLKVRHLDIPFGKLVVIIGKSGSGKSTILETLGLMNNTLIKGKIQFFPSQNESINLTDLWKDDEKIAEVRNMYFSFIFQDTNLMPNFTAYENACIPQLIQGTTLDESIRNVNIAMQLVGISDVNADTRVYNLSGGQKQRLAFVRAITPRFVVLFGDEPTGNLDFNNSSDLMKVIRSNIHARMSSSIIVSHDINLSVAYADQIIVLTKNNGYGEIRHENIYNAVIEDDKKIWLNSDSEPMHNFVSHLQKNLS